MGRITEKLTYANVMVSLLAIIVLGGGVAYAAEQLGKGSVGARELKRGAVISSKIKDHSIRPKDIAPGVLAPAPEEGKATATAPGGSPGSAPARYVWSDETYPVLASPQPDGRVASFNFTSPEAGFAIVTAHFAVRVANVPGTDCHVQSQLATAPAVLGPPKSGPGPADAPGYIDLWINGALPTMHEDGTWQGFGQAVSRVFPVAAGPNTVYLNGAFKGYGGGKAPNCAAAAWGPIEITATFASENPAASITVP